MSDDDRQPDVAELIAVGRDREAARRGAGEAVAVPDDSDSDPRPAGEPEGEDKP